MALRVAALAVASTLAAAWGLPLALVRLDRFATVSTSPDTCWTDGLRGGHYFHHRHPFFEWLDFRRIIFVGAVEDLPYYNQNRPPAWGAVVSLDQREGFEQVVTGVFGWPLRCFRLETWHSWREPTFEQQLPALIELLRQPKGKPSKPKPKPPYDVRRGVLLRDAAWPPKRLMLPLEPMWPGLVANTAIFAAAWSLVLLGPGVARRLVRARRGRCVGCGYPRVGLPPGSACPECGAPARAADVGAGGR